MEAYYSEHHLFGEKDQDTFPETLLEIGKNLTISADTELSYGEEFPPIPAICMRSIVNARDTPDFDNVQKVV